MPQCPDCGSPGLPDRRPCDACGTVVFRPSRRRATLAGVGSLGLAFGLANTLRTDAGTGFDWLIPAAATVLFGVVGLVSVVRALRPSPVFVLSHERLRFDPPVRSARTYPWDAIDRLERHESEDYFRTTTWARVTLAPDTDVQTPIGSRVTRRVRGTDDRVVFLPLSPYGVAFEALTAAAAEVTAGTDEPYRVRDELVAAIATHIRLAQVPLTHDELIGEFYPDHRRGHADPADWWAEVEQLLRESDVVEARDSRGTRWGLVGE